MTDITLDLRTGAQLNHTEFQTEKLRLLTVERIQHSPVEVAQRVETFAENQQRVVTRDKETQIANTLSRVCAYQAKEVRLSEWSEDITWGCDDVNWSFTYPFDHHEEILAAVIALDTGERSPALAYIAEHAHE